jgi:hypothetical protein
MHMLERRKRRLEIAPLLSNSRDGYFRIHHSRRDPLRTLRRAVESKLLESKQSNVLMDEATDASV